MTNSSVPAARSKNNLMAYRGDIEGLRAVAVFMVVFYHAHISGFNGGFTGVDIFFVLSGYLITNLLAREIEQTGHLNLLGFYARRLRRLMPASLVMVLVTILASCFLLPPLEQAHNFPSAVAAITYVSNLYFIRQSLDYLAIGSANSPFLHTWSLAVEEQFYLVWPLVVLLALRGSSPGRRLAWVLAVISAVSLILSVWLTFTHQVWAFFSSPTRAWEFGIGGIASLLSFPRIISSKPLVRILGYAGFALILLALFSFGAATAFPGFAALVPALGTVLLLIAGTARERIGPVRLLDNRFLKAVGGLSYSWYLWHWPALVIATSIYAGKIPLSVAWVCIIGSFALAALTYRVIENPVRVSLPLVRSSRLTLTWAAAGMLLSLGCLAGWHEWVHRQPQYGKFARAEADTPFLPNCTSDSSGVQVCLAGREQSPTIVLFGDSHAEQWTPPLQKIILQSGWKLVILTRPSCAAADVEVYHPELGRPDETCPEWRRKAIQKIREIKPSAVVLTSYSKGYVEPLGRLSVAAWEAGTRRTLLALSNATPRVFLINDTPTPSENIPACLSRSGWVHHPEALCAFQRRDQIFDRIVTSEFAAAKGLSHVTTLDLASFICGPALCDAQANGVVKFSDSHHLTASFTRSLAPALAGLLNAKGLPLKTNPD